MDGYLLSKKAVLCLLCFTSYMFAGEQRTSISAAFSDEDTSPRRFSLSDRQTPPPILDDLRDLENLQQPSALSVEDIMLHWGERFQKISSHITAEERKNNIEQILQKMHTKSHRHHILHALHQEVAVRKARAARLVDADDSGHAAQSQAVTRDFPISLGVGDIEPKLEPGFEWLFGQLIKKEHVVLGQKYTRQQLITGLATAAAFVGAIILEGVWNYVGTFYHGAA